MRCICPRSLLVVSSDDDDLAGDATELVAIAKEEYVAAGAGDNLSHVHTGGGHALDAERFSMIVEWLVARAASVTVE
jgi:hypothetical protein